MSEVFTLRVIGEKKKLSVMRELKEKFDVMRDATVRDHVNQSIVISLTLYHG